MPGLLQTVGRAEICAIVAALKFGIRCNQAVRIWSDNQYAVNNARRILRKQLEPHPLMPDHDLWILVQQLVASIPQVTFVHVGSHQSRDQIDEFQQWAFDNNDQADALAGRFTGWCSQELLVAQQQARFAYHRMLHLKGVAHRHYVKVAEFAVGNNPEKPHRALVEQVADPDLTAIDVSQVTRTVPFDAPQRLRFEGWIKVVSWMEAMYDPHAEVQWLSLTELLWSFQLHSGCRGVLSTGNHCTWKLDDLRNEYDGQQAIRSFGKYIVHLIQTKFPDIKTKSKRPSNYRFQCWTMCLAIRFDTGLRDRLHQWISREGGDRLIYTISRDVARFPPACEPDSMRSTSQVGLFNFFQATTTA